MIQQMTDLDTPLEERKQLDEMSSMNISMSGETAEEVASLMKIVQNAGINPEQGMSADTMPMRQDMERLNKIVSDPTAEIEPEKEITMGEEGYDNEPDEDYQDSNYMTKDSSGGLNKQKKSYKKAEDGDNPMAVENIKDRLYARLSDSK